MIAYFIVALQIFSFFNISFFFIKNYKRFNLELNLYTLAISIIFALLTLSIVLFTKDNVYLYIGIGAFIALLNLHILKFKINKEIDYTFYNKLILFFSYILVWPQLILFLFLYVKLQDKFNESL